MLFVLGPIWVAHGTSSTYVASHPPILVGSMLRCTNFVLASINNESRRRNSHHPPQPSKLVWCTSFEISLFMQWQDILSWLHTSFHLFWHSSSFSRARQKPGRSSGCLVRPLKSLQHSNPKYCNQWISDEEWIDIIHTNFFTPLSKEGRRRVKI